MASPSFKTHHDCNIVIKLEIFNLEKGFYWWPCIFSENYIRKTFSIWIGFSTYRVGKGTKYMYITDDIYSPFRFLQFLWHLPFFNIIQTSSAVNLYIIAPKMSNYSVENVVRIQLSLSWVLALYVWLYSLVAANVWELTETQNTENIIYFLSVWISD